MNDAHIHLALNHLPVIGSAFSFLVLFTGWIFRNHSIRLMGFALFVISGLLVFPAFISGSGAEDQLKGLGLYEREWVHPHEELGEVSFYLCLITAGIAALGFMLERARKRFRVLVLILTLVFALVTGFFFTLTGLSGGEIRHTEVRKTQTIFTQPDESFLSNQNVEE